MWAKVRQNGKAQLSRRLAELVGHWFYCGLGPNALLQARKNLPIECAQGDRPARCPIFCLQ